MATRTTPIYADIPPAFLSLPAKFDAFRPAQAEALEYAIYESKRGFTALGLPTGSGKSLLAIAVAKALGVKAVYLTASRGLQDQVVEEFRGAGAVDVRGRANYECSGPFRNCDDGHKNGCVFDGGSTCAYEAAVDAARRSDIVVTNYSYWMNVRRWAANALATDERPVELLICDEVPEAPELIADFVSVRFSHDDVELPWRPSRGEKYPSGIMPDVTWTTFAAEFRRDLLERVKRLVKGDPAADDLRSLVDSCDRIHRMDSNWVWEVDRRGVTFTPIRPGPYARALWSGVPRVLLISATLRPYTLSLLGLSKDNYDFREWPAVFPPHLGPVYYYPGPEPVKLTYKSPEEDFQYIVGLMDDWLDARADRRALIQAGSYDRAGRIKAASRHSSRMIVNESGRDAARCASDFRRTENAILCSPSFVAGWDFADDACELVLIPKVPYPNTESRAVSERCKDKEYRLYTATQDIVQGAGRARRHSKDRCEVVIFDAGLKWVLGPPNRPFHGHAPQYFRVQEIGRIPAVPPRALSSSPSSPLALSSQYRPNGTFHENS